MSYQSRTLDAYNQIAKSYYKTNHKESIVNLMKTYYSLFQKFLPSGNIYDIGCGTGRDTHQLSLLGYNVVGFDYSEEMLEVAKLHYPSCSFNKMDILNELHTLPDVNGVWASASLLHFNPYHFQRILLRIKELLCDNGVFYLSMKLCQNRYNEQYINKRYFCYYNEDYLMNLFEQCNFKLLYFNQSVRTSDSVVFGHYYLKKH